ncbi:MAG: hypothetical protein RMJ87_04625 [Cytophagales bacterium]|nr:hypothetical protein [Bernardetiaceae bacterium]MDW8204296.1 hypothetical protein [Cytophagales bacterium]
MLARLLISLPIVIWLLASSSFLQAQKIATGDITDLYAATKQLSQFIKRFNNEEDRQGVAYAPNSKLYREPEQRKQYLKWLFDDQSASISPSLKTAFIADITRHERPIYLDFFGSDWFAEVKITVSYSGKEEEAILFMVLEKERNGYKWVIDRVYFRPYAPYLKPVTKNQNNFLHPQSHELGFMNLNRIFESPLHVEDYTSKGYQSPTHLDIFLYDLRRGAIKFVTVQDTRFHFFQIPGWYFEIAYFNRSGLNSGWLISNLVQVPTEQKELMLNYVYRENR